MIQLTLPSLASGRSKKHAGRINFLLAGFLFKIALDVAYATYLTGAFTDHFLTPFIFNFSAFQYLESFVWLGLVLLIVPSSSKSAGGLAFFAAIVFFCAPMASIYGMDAERSRDVLVLSVLAIGVAHLVSAVVIQRGGKIKLPKVHEKYLIFLSIFLIGMFLTAAAASRALLNMNFAIDEVYDLRDEQGAKVDIGILIYTNLWAQKVFTPLILAIGLQRKSIWLVGFALIMFFIYFGVTQHRTHLFTPLLVLFCYIVYRRDFSYARGLVLCALALFFMSALISIFELETLSAITIRRALFVGPSAAYTWVEYFAEHPKVFFADNLLASIVRNEYTGTNLPFYLGDYLRANYDIGFNAGLVATGFAQLGVFGVIMYAAIIGVVIRINNALIEAGVPPYISASIFFLPYRVAWADSDLFTTLLSHGLLVGTFAVWLFGSPRKTQVPGTRAGIVPSAGK